MQNEKSIEKILRKYLEGKGWRAQNTLKKRGEHGIDIKMWHRTRRKVLLIEIKAGKYPHQSFYSMIGEILFRMDRPGNSTRRARIYSIGIPSSWKHIFQNKAKQMSHAWKLLNLRIYVVGRTPNDVQEFTASKFLKHLTSKK